MTKAEWISVIKNTLAKVDEQGRFREQLLERHISSVYTQMFNELYAQKPREIHKYVQQYTESISGVTDLSTGRTITKIPIALNRVNGGVFKAKTTTKDFLLTNWQNYNYAVDDDFDTSGFKGDYMATVQGDTLYANTSTLATDTITYYMIVEFTELAETDEVLIPGGAEDHFIDRVIMTIQQMPPTDLINDNTIQ